MNGQMWGEMLDVLKDIGTYLAKQDAIQERASIDKAPKISETQKAIKGDDDVKHGFEPGKGVAKATLVRKYVDVPEEGRENETFVPSDEETSQLSKEEGFEERFQQEPEDEEEEYTEEEEEEDEGDGGEEGYGDEGQPSGEDLDQLKSLLKDIRSSLSQQAKATASSGSLLNKSELKKAIQPLIKEEAQRMIRKMGFNPSRADVVRFGVEDSGNVIKKSVERERESVDEAGRVVEDLSKLSWSSLGALREKTGQFNPFYK